MQDWNLTHGDVHGSLDYHPALTADGIRDLIASRAEIAIMARELFPAETLAIESSGGHGVRIVPIATGAFNTPGKSHAIAIYVHRDNPLEEISTLQLAEIFARPAEGSTAADPLTWDRFVVDAGFQGHPIRPIGMVSLRESGNPPGIVNYLETEVFGRRQDGGRVREIPAPAGSHPLQEIVDEVAADPFAIGYSGFAFSNDDAKTLRIVGDDGGPSVEGTPETVASRKYPLTRTVYVAANQTETGTISQSASQFIQFILSPTEQRCLVEDEAKFIPLPEAERQLADQLASIEE